MGENILPVGPPIIQFCLEDKTPSNSFEETERKPIIDKNGSITANISDNSEKVGEVGHKANNECMNSSVCNSAINLDIKLELLEGENTEELQPRIFECGKCNYNTTDEAAFRKHEVSYSQFKAYKCERCNFSTNFNREYKAHIDVHSRTSDYTSCPICNQIFASMALFLFHKIKVHIMLLEIENGQYKCSECFRICDKQSIWDHLTRHFVKRERSSSRYNHASLSNNVTVFSSNKNRSSEEGMPFNRLEAQPMFTPNRNITNGNIKGYCDTNEKINTGITVFGSINKSSKNLVSLNCSQAPPMFTPNIANTMPGLKENISRTSSSYGTLPDGSIPGTYSSYWKESKIDATDTFLEPDYSVQNNQVEIKNVVEGRSSKSNFVGNLVEEHTTYIKKRARGHPRGKYKNTCITLPSDKNKQPKPLPSDKNRQSKPKKDYTNILRTRTHVKKSKSPKTKINNRFIIKSKEFKKKTFQKCPKCSYSTSSGILFKKHVALHHI